MEPTPAWSWWNILWLLLIIPILYFYEALIQLKKNNGHS